MLIIQKILFTLHLIDLAFSLYRYCESHTKGSFDRVY